MTAETARRPSLEQRMVKDWIWLAVVTRIVGDRRFQASVITDILGTYALASLIKNNQLRPVRRAVHWYNVKGHVHGVRVLHRARQAVKPGKR